MSQREAFELMLKEDRYDEVTHRVFADWLSEQGLDAEAEYHYSWTREKQEAIDWFANAAKELNVSAEYLVQAGTKRITEGVRTSANHRDDISNYYYNNDDKFWRNWSLVTGKPKPDEKEYEVPPFICCNSDDDYELENEPL